jgi:radical SAM protein with 4Fe4S-binding SPASM domain
MSSSASSLPPDAELHPVSGGALLLSRDYALYCRVPAESVAAVRRVLDGLTSFESLAQPLQQSLRVHGFCSGPRQAAPIKPSVQLQLTNSCNLRCSYCCTDSGAARSNEVTLAELTRVVDEALAAFGPSVHFGILGGEPFLVDWAVDLVAYILQQGSALTVFSNGIALTQPVLCERVADLMRRGAELRISLAAADAVLCDNLSGAARFEGALRAVDMLAARGVLPSIDVMVLPQHVQVLAAHLPRLRERLPPQTPLSFGILYRGGRERGEHLFKSRRQLEQALDYIVFEAAETIRVTPRKAVAYRREGCSCALGHHLHVRSDGRLYSCFKMDEAVGELRAQGFEAVAKAAAARVRSACSLTPCADCSLNTLCGGGCRSENFADTGSADQPLCGEWRKQVCYELLAEDLPDALEWPTDHLVAEARARGISVPIQVRS